MTKQPIWKQVVQLGDVNPLDYGGLFVYVDETGVYPPEMERVQSADVSEDGDITEWETRRVVLENLKLVTDDIGVYLVTARFDVDCYARPIAPYDEWFHKDLASVASYVDSTVEEMRANLTSDDPVSRATAWRAIGDYHGWDNLDAYPNKWTERAELMTRYGLK